MFCPACSLVQITESVPPEELFGDYLYFSSFSDTMLQSASAIAERLVRERGLGSDSLVVEVASNDGYLLQYYAEAGVPVLGIEPAANIAAVAEAERGIPTLVEFFGEELARRLVGEGRRADVIHANNVLAHVPDLNGVVAGFSQLLKPTGVVVVEAPYLVDFIDRIEFDTIYHEHLCYFSLTALNTLFARHGLTIVDVERLPIHGGSLRIFASPTAPTGAPPAERSQRVVDLLAEEAAWGVGDFAVYAGFADSVSQPARRTACAARRTQGRRARRIAAYGASAKGSTLLNYCGIGSDTLDFVVDRSTVKQGLFTPGTHLPILAPTHLLEAMPDYVLLLTWNFADEILRQQAEYLRQGRQVHRSGADTDDHRWPPRAGERGFVGVLFHETPLAGATVLEPQPSRDERGYFARVWCAEELAERGMESAWVQSSVSFNEKALTLRGLHYQVEPHTEVKLVRCTSGAVFDVIVDLREALRHLSAVVLDRADRREQPRALRAGRVRPWLPDAAGPLGGGVSHVGAPSSRRRTGCALGRSGVRHRLAVDAFGHERARPHLGGLRGTPMSRVLVTGASGFIGSHCVPLLIEAGYDVHGVVPEGVEPPGRRRHVAHGRPARARSGAAAGGRGASDAPAAPGLVRRPGRVLEVAGEPALAAGRARSCTFVRGCRRRALRDGRDLCRVRAVGRTAGRGRHPDTANHALRRLQGRLASLVVFVLRRAGCEPAHGDTSSISTARASIPAASCRR